MGCRAIIYTGADNPGPAIDRCLRHCIEHGYQVTAVIIDHGNGWHDAIRALADNLADVLVVASVAEMPPDRLPRIEVAGGRRAPPSDRRPRRV